MEDGGTLENSAKKKKNRRRNMVIITRRGRVKVLEVLLNLNGNTFSLSVALETRGLVEPVYLHNRVLVSIHDGKW